MGVRGQLSGWISSGEQVGHRSWGLVSVVGDPKGGDSAGPEQLRATKAFIEDKIH